MAEQHLFAPSVESFLKGSAGPASGSRSAGRSNKKPKKGGVFDYNLPFSRP